MEILVFLVLVVGIAITAAISVVSGVFSSLFAVIAEEEDSDE